MVKLSEILETQIEKKQPIERFCLTEKKTEFYKFCLKIMNTIVQDNSANKKSLQVTPELNDVLVQIFMYLNRDPELEKMKTSVDRFWNLDAGILFVGNFGTGKTLILNSIRQISNEMFKRGVITGIKGKKATARDIAKAHMSGITELGHIIGIADNDFFIDELGDEPFSVKLYGTEENPVYNVLKEKLDYWDSSPKKPRLFVTTNLKKQDIIDRYSERIWSRLVGCTNIVVLGTNEQSIDYRKL